jgi:hypothetical protein
MSTLKSKNRINGPEDDGWIPVSDTWTRSSGNTLNVPNASRYSFGDRIKLVQDNTTKYFAIIGKNSTQIGLTGGGDYSITASAISEIYYSHQASPVGYPDYFNFQPILSATSGGVSFGNGVTWQGTFKIIGKTIHWRGTLSAGGTGYALGSGLYSLSLPVTPIGSFPITGSGWLYNGAFFPLVMDVNRLIKTSDGAMLGNSNCGSVFASGTVLAMSGSYQYAA